MYVDVLYVGDRISYIYYIVFCSNIITFVVVPFCVTCVHSPPVRLHVLHVGDIISYIYYIVFCLNIITLVVVPYCFLYISTYINIRATGVNKDAVHERE